ncbi:MAG: C1 family peptidase [Akkermansiaceae bacterium]
MSSRKKVSEKPAASVPDVAELNGRVLSARPDLIDFRDKMYVPTLVDVPSLKPLEDYQSLNLPILDQGREGACTGFALAAMANFLTAKRINGPLVDTLSERMLYEMARRNDEWPGEDYSGSSARGAMKGWNKYGVCRRRIWPYKIGETGGDLTHERLEDARRCPLGAYFRVNHKDLVAMHSAIAETGMLYATSLVHKGWQNVKPAGVIQYSENSIGGHAFVIVGYDEKGFWIQNSWGDDWGRDGFAHLSYYDWLENGSDVWVGRLGVPITIDSSSAFTAGTFPNSQMSQSATISDLRPHVISLGNGGLPKRSGDFSNTSDEIRNFIRKDFPRITSTWKKKRILLYAHGGLVGQKSAVQRIAEYREAMMGAEVYPIAFVWNSDFWSTIKNILSDAIRSRRSEGLLEKAKDFMLDRLDSTLEPVARGLGGKAAWDEMKENALAATENQQGGAALVVKELKKLLKKEPDIEIHVAGHSAGSIFMGPLVKALSKFTTISTCTLWAPACTVDLFKKYYLPQLKGSGRSIREFALYTLSDKAEQDDDTGKIYNKSLLSLVANALEEEFHPLSWRWQGMPILGMERFVKADADLKELFRNKTATHVLSPNGLSGKKGSRANSHGAFDDDAITVRGTLIRILGAFSAASQVNFASSAARSERIRHSLPKMEGDE